MTHVGLLLALPRAYTRIQFTYRIETYVLMGLSAAILAALALAQGGPRRAQVWTWLAVPVCIVSLVGVSQQLSSLPNPGQDRYGALESYGEVEANNSEAFQDVAAPVLAGRHLPTLEIPPESISGDHVSFATDLSPGTLAATNIGAGPYLVRVTGAKAVGVDSETGDMVLQIGSDGDARTGPVGKPHDATTGSSQHTISVSTGNSLPIVLGRALTLVGLAILTLELLALPARGLLSRRARDTSGT